MNRTSLILTTLLAPALALGAPAESPSPADAAKAQIAVEAANACASGKIDLLGESGANEQSAKFLSIAGSDSLAYLKLHQACLTAASDAPRSCDALASVPNGKKDCLDDVEFANTASAILGKGDALAACERFITPQGRAWKTKAGKPRDKAKHAQRCAFFVPALKRGSTDVCGEGEAAGVLGGPALEQCRRHWIYLNGVPDLCSADQDKFDEPVCREKAALLSALRTKDFRACALSPWCRVLSSGKAASCDPYLDSARKLFCAQVTEDVAPMMKAKAASDAKIAEMKAKEKKKFAKGAPMRFTTPDVEKSMKKIEEKRNP